MAKKIELFGCILLSSRFYSFKKKVFNKDGECIGEMGYLARWRGSECPLKELPIGYCIKRESRSSELSAHLPHLQLYLMDHSSSLTPEILEKRNLLREKIPALRKLDGIKNPLFYSGIRDCFFV